MTIMENIRRASAGIPLSCTMVDRKRVKKVKLSMNPITTPKGRDFPMFFPPIVELRMMGKMGRMHGESTVTIPARNANVISKIIFLILACNWSNCPLFHFVIFLAG